MSLKINGKYKVKPLWHYKLSFFIIFPVGTGVEYRKSRI